MSKLALQLPGFDNRPDNYIQNTPHLFDEFINNPDRFTLGFVLSQFVTLALFVAGFFMIFFMAWGIYQYILARGNKEELAHARSRIWWAMLGFLILIMAIFISQYVQSLYPEGLYKRLQIVTPP